MCQCVTPKECPYKALSWTIKDVTSLKGKQSSSLSASTSFNNVSFVRTAGSFIRAAESFVKTAGRFLAKS